MRRISINNPNKKLRGLRRHFRELKRWANLIKNRREIEHGEKYFNIKVPLPLSIVEGPKTRPKIQADVIKELLNAARNLACQAPPANCSFYRIAVLLSFPSMFDSEVTQFFDEEYFNGFVYENGLPDTQRPSQQFSIKIPAEFDIECGCRVSVQDEEYSYVGNCWTITSSTPHSPPTDNNANAQHTWSVWRQGDDGNRFLIEAGLSEDVAKQKVAEFESHGHKQLYWATQSR